MAAITFTVNDITRDGLTTPAGTAFTAGDTGSFTNDGKTFLRVRNTGASAAAFSITTPGTVDGLAVANRSVTIPITTGDKLIGPFPPSFYNDGSDLVAVSTDQPVLVDVFRI